MSGRSHSVFIKEMRSKGYEVHMIFLWLKNVDLALKRISDRVKSGGHNVPEDVVRRRFSRGIMNFFSIYAKLSDTWTLFDNSYSRPIVIAKDDNRKMTIPEKELFERIRKSMEEA
jgi:predicted ABC-type ATPase